MNYPLPGIPDSPLAREATQLVYELSPSFLYQHCMRTYMFGELLGRRDSLKYDQELLYLGSVLHDLGLTHRFEGKGSFEIEGADAAQIFLAEHGLPEDKGAIVRDAIALHASLEAEQRQPEIALVHFGAGVDVIGLRLQDLPSEVVQQVVAAYPRYGFKQAFQALLEEQARRKPGTLSEQLVQPGFLEMLHHAPFSE